MMYVCPTSFHTLGVDSLQLHSLQIPPSSLVGVLLTLRILLADVYAGFEEKEMQLPWKLHLCSQPRGEGNVDLHEE